MRKTFGIVGATGATGQQVLSAVQNLGTSRILVGGRTPAMLRLLVVKSGGTIEARRLNIQDPNLMDSFCAEAETIINCVGPASSYFDAVAQAAYRNKCNYVDASGLYTVSLGLDPIKDKIREAGLTFVLSAGWMPGITEILPAYAYDIAKEKFGSVSRISVFFGDWGHWSDNALADANWYLRNRKAQSPGTFQQGVWKAERSVSFRKESLGEPLVESQFASFYTPELESLGKAITDADFEAWVQHFDERGVALSAAAAFMPFKQAKSAGVIRKAFDEYNQPVGGFIVAKAETQEGNCCTVIATYGKGRDYEINGAALATAACLVSQHAAYPGVQYFWQAFNRPNAIEWLTAAGVRISETFT
jgi:saccharopine dehydrogenase (NAD+, L-lysine-forming)